MFITKTAYPFGHLPCLGVMMVKLQNQHCYHHRQTNDDHDASEILSCKQNEDFVKLGEIQGAGNIPWPQDLLLKSTASHLNSLFSGLLHWST